MQITGKHYTLRTTDGGSDESGLQYEDTCNFKTVTVSLSSLGETQRPENYGWGERDSINFCLDSFKMFGTVVFTKIVKLQFNYLNPY